MERSDNSSSMNMDFGLDIELCTPPCLRDPLMKYNTMGDPEEIKEIELSSEFSQFEGSQESETGSEHRLPTLGICSETEQTRKKSFPKLLRLGPVRKGSSEELSTLYPLQTNFNLRYLKGHRRITAETENSEDEMKSTKSRKQMQKENLVIMIGFIFQFTWMIVYCLALSATGPLLIGLPGDNMFVLMTWKLQITLIVFIPLSYIELRYKSSGDGDYRIRFKKILYILFASMMYLIWFMGLLEA